MSTITKFGLITENDSGDLIINGFEYEYDGSTDARHPYVILVSMIKDRIDKELEELKNTLQSPDSR